MLKREAAVVLFKHLIDHEWHGYSQPHRWGDGEGVCAITIDGQVFKLEQGDRDCSSAIISAYEAAGISCGGATYTGNMQSLMVKSGNFKWHGMNEGYQVKPGDIYLNHVNHTAMVTATSPTQLGEFSISETGGIDGATGDQTGNESHYIQYYNYPWDGILECINSEKIKNEPELVQPDSAPLNETGIYYRGWAQTLGLLPVRHDGQVCGTVGFKKRLEGLYIDVRTLRRRYSDGIKISATVHIQKDGWVKYNNIEHDTFIGTKDQQKRLEAIKLTLTGLDGKALKYRVHLDKYGWTDWVKNGEVTGTTGIKCAIQAIQIAIE